MHDDDDDLGPRKLAAIVDKRQDAVVIEKADGGAGDLAGALLRHLHDRLENKRAAHGFEKKEHPMNRTETLRDIVKTAGIYAAAKTVVDSGRGFGLSEAEFTEIATEDAVRIFPNAKTPAAAFSQMFTDNSPYGLTLRRAHALVRAEQLYGPTAKAADRGSNSAYAELMRKAETYREAHPELSVAQCFEKIYCDRANVALRQRERQEAAAR
jgi:hypothetical protein